MVESFASSFGGGDGDGEIVLDPVLAFEIIQGAWPQAGLERQVLFAGFAGYDAGDIATSSSFLRLIL